MDRHEVPTHLDIEDHLFWGLTMPRLFGVVATLGAAYGLHSRFPWEHLPLPDSWRTAVRWAAPLLLAVVGLSLSLVRPSGRPLASWLADILLFALGPRAYLGNIGPKEGDGRS